MHLIINLWFGDVFIESHCMNVKNSLALTLLLVFSSKENLVGFPLLPKNIWMEGSQTASHNSSCLPQGLDQI